MKIYESEHIDGLADKLCENSVAFICDIVDSIDVSDASEDVQRVVAAFNQEKQADLYYMNSILVSAGWNKNDDVFDVEDLFNARYTPINKPLNYMHNDTDIVGHMIASEAIDEDGNVIKEKLPDRMDIVTSAVIYKVWSDPDQKERVKALIQDIEDRKLAVSMECVFNNFDYALISPNGDKKFLARSEESSFLTKHLRIYGGSGEFQGYKIGRLLRNFSFTGKGLVNKPANPRSIILPKESETFGPTKSNMVLTAMEVPMEELEQAKASIDSLTSENESQKNTIASLTVKITELEQTIADINQEKLNLHQELHKLVAEAKSVARKNALISAGADEAKACELVDKFAEASDELFDTVVALIVPVKKEVIEVEAEVEDETHVLETVKTVPETIVNVIEPKVVDKISRAASWLEQHVLKTTNSQESK